MTATKTKSHIGCGKGLEESGAYREDVMRIMEQEPYKSHFAFVKKLGEKEREAAKKIR